MHSAEQNTAKVSRNPEELFCWCSFKEFSLVLIIASIYLSCSLGVLSIYIELSRPGGRISKFYVYNWRLWEHLTAPDNFVRFFHGVGCGMQPPPAPQCWLQDTVFRLALPIHWLELSWVLPSRKKYLRMVGTIFISWLIALPVGAILAIILFYIFKTVFGSV